MISIVFCAATEHYRFRSRQEVHDIRNWGDKRDVPILVAIPQGESLNFLLLKGCSSAGRHAPSAVYAPGNNSITALHPGTVQIA